MSIIGRIARIFRPEGTCNINTGNSAARRVSLETPQDTFSFSKKSDLEEGNPLNKYKPGRHFRCCFDGQTAFWRSKSGDSPKISPWKLHIYSDNKKDYVKLLDTIGPYLIDKRISWKTFADEKKIDEISEKQRGKAFTIYPASDRQMAQTASDLDYIIRNNNLELNGASITGDRELGNTGRIFYRYQYSSGKLKDVFLDISTSRGYDEYMSYYDENRGKDGYLADDMTEADDPWFNFDPSNPQLKAFDKEEDLIRLKKNVLYNITGDETLYLADGIEVYLPSPSVSRQLRELPEGGTYTIGRSSSCDLVINSSQTVSRRHADIYKKNGKLYICDLSLNGTSMKKSRNFES